MRMFCARSISVSMMVLELRSVPSESMNILSILMMSTPSLSMYERPLWPVPTSSIATLTPSPCSAAMTRRVSVRFSIGWRSVTSRTTCDRRNGDFLKILRTSSTISSSAKWRAVRLNPILRCGRAADHGACLLADAPHQRARQIDDEAARLGERNERGRRHDGAVRLAPADQHLRAAQPARADVDDRLEVRHEFAGLERRSISAIGLSRWRLGSSTESARMMIARSPLAIVPNARRSPWLAARPSGDADMVALSA